MMKNITTYSLLLAFLWAGSIASNAKSVYHWESVAAPCEWHAQASASFSLWEDWGLLSDTIRPALSSFTCDIVCPDFQANWISIDADCGQANGRAEVIPVGFPAGTTFSYQWEGGLSNGPVAENLAAGIYQVTVSIDQLVADQGLRNCDIEVEVVVATKDGPNVQVGAITGSNCDNFAGSARLQITGGQPPYQIDWGSGSAVLSSDGEVVANNLLPKQYTFFVTDANGCASSRQVVIPNLTAFFELSGQAPSACGLNDGSLTIAISGGAPPYNIVLNGLINVQTNNTSYTFQNLFSGYYTVEVSSGVHCSAVDAIALNVECPPSVDGWSSVDADCPDGLGYLIYDGSGSGNGFFQVRQATSGFVIASVPENETAVIEVRAGDYEFRYVQSNNDCICKFGLSVGQPSPLSAQLELRDGGCEPDADENASIAIGLVEGGTPPYQAIIRDAAGNIVADSDNLPSGIYTVIITDQLGCTLTTEVELISEPFFELAIGSADTLICEGEPLTLSATLSPPLATVGITWTSLAGDSIGAGPNITVNPELGSNTYIATGQGLCRAAADTILVQVIGDEQVAITANETEACIDTSIILSSSQSFAEFLVWTDVNGSILGSGASIAVSSDFGAGTVIATIPDADCIRPDSLSITFEENPPPLPPLLPEVLVLCEGQDTILDLSSYGYEFTWVLCGEQPIDTQSDQLTITASEVGQQCYAFSATNACGTVSAEVQVFVVADEQINAEPDTIVLACEPLDEAICVTATAQGFPDSLIVWTDLDGNPLGTGGELCVTPDPGLSVYIATAPGLDCVSPDTVRVQVDTEAPPLPPGLPELLKLCEGQDTVLDLSGYPLPFTWATCDGDIIAVTDGQLVIPAGAACYVFTASNGCGDVVQEVNVGIIPEQQLDAQPDTTIFACEPINEAICLTATGQEIPDSCIVWTDLDGSPLGTGGELCVTPGAGLSVYIATAPGLDCVSPDTVRVQVDTEEPPLPPGLPNLLKLCEGQDTVLDLSGYPLPFTWATCDGDIIPVTDGQLVIPAGAACYVFTASNGCGDVVQEVNVRIIPEQQLDAQPDTTIFACEPINEAICLTATGQEIPDSCIVWTDEAGTLLGTGGELCVTPGPGLSVYIATAPGLDCVSPDTVRVQVDTEAPPLPPGLPELLKLCEGQDTVLDLSGYPLPFTWATCDGDIIAVTDGQLVIPAGAACYVFTASNGCGDVVQEVNVGIIPDQQLDAQPDTTIFACEPINEAICLTATGQEIPDSCIVWTDEAGTVLGTGGELCVTPGAGLSVYIATAPGLDCVSPDTVRVQVDTEAPPLPPGLPELLKLCEGQDTVLDLSDYGFAFTWATCDGDIIAVTDGQLVIPAGAACYVFTASNGCGDVVQEVNVGIIPEQQLDAQPDTTIFACEPINEEICLTATGQEIPDSCIVWTDEAGTVLGTGGELCVTPGAGLSVYIATAPGLDCVSPDTVRVQVDTEEPPLPPGLPELLKLCEGQDTVLDLSGYPLPFTWATCDGDIIAVVDGQLVIPAGAACYVFTASNGCGDVVQEVNVGIIPEQQLDAQPDTTIFACEPINEEICLTATGQEIPDSCIVWTDEAGTVLGTGGELCVTPGAGLSVYIATAPGLDCVSPDTVRVQVDTEAPPLPPGLPELLKLCEGQDTVLDLSGYGFAFTWATCGGDEITVDNGQLEIPGVAACYVFTAANACDTVSQEVNVVIIPDQQLDAQPDTTIFACEPINEAICLTATGQEVPDSCIVWTDLDGNSLGTGGELCVTPGPGLSVYIATAPGLDCVSPDTVRVQVDTEAPPLPPGLPELLKLCEGQDTVLDLSGYGFAFTWAACGGDEITVANGQLEIPGVAACYVFTAANACDTVSQEVNVGIIPEQQLDAQPDTTIFACEPINEAICLTATGQEIPDSCIVWTDEAGTVLGTGGELCVTPGAGLSVYIATAPGLDCVSPDTVRVQVDTEAPPLPPGLPELLKLCEGQDTVLDLSGYPLPFTWATCDGDIIAVTDGQLVIPAGAACYVFTASNGCGDVVQEVNVGIIPEQQLDAQPDTTIFACEPINEEICLTATGQEIPDSCIVWTDLDGSPLGTGGELCVTPGPGLSVYIATAPGLDCVSPDTVRVQVDTEEPPLPPGLPNLLKLCEGQDTVLDLSGYPLPFTWATCDGDIIAVTDGQLVIPAGAACYVFTASNGCGDVVQEVNVGIIPEQQLDAQPDTTIFACEPINEEICLTATGQEIPDSCIVWTDLDGSPLGTGGELCVTPGPGLSVYIATAPGLDCVSPDTVRVQVDTEEPPLPPGLPELLKLCEGQDTVLDLSGYPLPFTWATCGGDIIAVTDGQLVIPAVAACYIFTASNGCGEVVQEVNVGIIPEQQLDAQPDTTIFACEPIDEEICLTATGQEIPDSCIVWTDEAGTVLGTGGELCVTPGPGLSVYIATAPGLDCVSPDTVRVQVDTEEPPLPPGLPELLKLCEGQDTVLDLSGYPLPFTWATCDGDIIAVTDGQLVIPAGAACYVFTASNGCGDVVQEVNVGIIPEQQLDAQPDTTIFACEPIDEEICLTATGQEIPDSCIVWTDEAGTVLGTGGELCVTPGPGLSVYIATAPGLDCVSPDTVRVQVDTEEPPLPPGLPNLLKLCEGQDTVLDLSGYPLPFTWATCDGDIIAVTDGQLVIPAGAACYVFTASNGCGDVVQEVNVSVVPEQQIAAQPDTTILACAPVNEPITLTATVQGIPDSCIVWTDGAGNELGTGAELQVTPPEGVTLYIASAPGLDCVLPDTVRVQVDTEEPPSLPNLPTMLSLCVGDTDSISLGNYDAPYTWLDEAGEILADGETLVITADSVGTSQFLLVVENGCGSLSHTLTLTVVDSAAVMIMPDETIVVCDDEAVTLTATSPFPDGIVWTDGTGNVIDTAAQITVTPMPGLNLYIASQLGLACIVPDTARIEFITEGDLEVTAEASADMICLGDSVTLSATVTPESEASIVSWYDGDFNFIDEGLTLVLTPDEAGLLTFFAIADNGCAVDTASVDVEVESLDVFIEPVPTNICRGESVPLKVGGCEDCTYEWSPAGTLSNPNEASTLATPTETTTYTVTVTGGGCVEVLSVTINVETCRNCESDNIFVPDAFTPNDDGINDFACVRSEYLNEFNFLEFIIYNRWGQEVFRSNDLGSLCWDGHFNGEALTPDVYGYYLRIICEGEAGEEDQEVVMKGNITLLR